MRYPSLKELLKNVLLMHAENHFNLQFYADVCESIMCSLYAVQYVHVFTLLYMMCSIRPSLYYYFELLVHLCDNNAAIKHNKTVCDSLL